MKVITYSVLRSKITEGRKDPRVSHSLSLSRSAHRSSSGLPRRRARRPGRRPHRRHRRARRLAEDLLGKRHVRPQIRVLRHNVPPGRYCCVGWKRLRERRPESIPVHAARQWPLRLFWLTRRDLLHRSGCYLGIPTANLDGIWGRRWTSHGSFPRSHRVTRPPLSKWSRQRRTVYLF